MNCTIRRATVDDVDGFARVLVDGWLWAYGGFMPPEFMAPRCDLGLRAERLRASWEAHGRNWVAVDPSGGIAAIASEQVPPRLENCDCEIGALYVHPDSARRGIGRSMVKTLAERFVTEGCLSMAVHTLAQNEIGCSFYERLGGQRVKADEWCGFEAVWFVWRDLPKLVRSL